MKLYNGKITAVFLAKNGYDNDVPRAIKAGLTKGNKYEVESVSMGQSHTYVYLKDVEDKGFNSVMFDFFKTNGDVVDLVNTVWNPYRQRGQAL